MGVVNNIPLCLGVTGESDSWVIVRAGEESTKGAASPTHWIGIVFFERLGRKIFVSLRGFRCGQGGSGQKKAAAYGVRALYSKRFRFNAHELHRGSSRVDRNI